MGIHEVSSPIPAPLLASLTGPTAHDHDQREAVRSRLDRWQGVVEALRPIVIGASDYLDDLKREQQVAVSSDLEAAIPVLLDKERRLAAQREQVLGLIESLRSSASELAPELLADVKQTSTTLDDLLVTWLETLRDLRWEAMMILADREPPSEGTKLSTPEQVQEWFAGLDAPDA